MEENKVIEINKESWNKLVKGNKNYSNTSLPEYGPFMNNENKFEIFKDVKEKKALEIGCAKGISLKYLYNKGAKEVWGIDISEEQIKYAKENIPDGKFFVSEMEKNPGIPENYFDYCISLYSIGYTSNLERTIALISKYLKKGGKFVMSWTHPFFNCLGIENDKIIIKKSYNDESISQMKKGEENLTMLVQNFKISTIVNLMIKNNLAVEKIIEDEPITENHIGNYKSKTFCKEKLQACSTTLIIIAKKN